MSARWFLAILPLLCASCADRVAGKGVASETTNGVLLSGTLRDGDARPVAGRMVELRDPAEEAVLASDRTDSLGHWEMTAPRAGRYLVASRSDSLGASAWITVGVAAAQSVDPLVQTNLVRLRGRVGSAPIDPVGVSVVLPALGIATTVAADSTWTLVGVPPGSHFLRFLAPGGAVVGEGAFSTYAAGVAILSADLRVRLDDFEGGEGGSRLQPILDGAWWGRWNDTSMIVDSARTWGGTPGLSTDSGAHSGKSLRVPMRVGAAFPTRPDIVRSAGLQLMIGGREDLDSQAVWFPMAGIDSVVFWAKGSGTISFEIKARSASDHAQGGVFKHSFVLGAAWTRCAFAASEFTSAEGLVWSRSQVRELWWTTRDPVADLWLDDIELAGIRISDLLRR